MNESAYIHFGRKAFRVFALVAALLFISIYIIPPASAVSSSPDSSSSAPPPAGTSSAEDMWEAADRIIKDVYNRIAGISTVLAGLMSAVSVIGAKLSNNQHKSDNAWDWLKRIWIAWVIINGIGAFLAYVRPLFQGLNTLS